MYLMDHQTPSYRTFGYFINEILQDKIEQVQIYSKNANDLRSTIKTAFSNTQDTKDIVSELRFNNIQSLAKSNE